MKVIDRVIRLNYRYFGHAYAGILQRSHTEQQTDMKGNKTTTQWSMWVHWAFERFNFCKQNVSFCAMSTSMITVHLWLWSRSAFACRKRKGLAVWWIILQSLKRNVLNWSSHIGPSSLPDFLFGPRYFHLWMNWGIKKLHWRSCGHNWKSCARRSGQLNQEGIYFIAFCVKFQPSAPISLSIF